MQSVVFLDIDRSDVAIQELPRRVLVRGGGPHDVAGWRNGDDDDTLFDERSQRLRGSGVGAVIAGRRCSGCSWIYARAGQFKVT
jgi:hypothetical protein